MASYYNPDGSVPPPNHQQNTLQQLLQSNGNIIWSVPTSASNNLGSSSTVQVVQFPFDTPHRTAVLPVNSGSNILHIPFVIQSFELPPSGVQVPAQSVTLAPVPSPSPPPSDNNTIQAQNLQLPGLNYNFSNRLRIVQNNLQLEQAAPPVRRRASSVTSSSEQKEGEADPSKVSKKKERPPIFPSVTKSGSMSCSSNNSNDPSSNIVFKRPSSTSGTSSAAKRRSSSSSSASESDPINQVQSTLSYCTRKDQNHILTLKEFLQSRRSPAAEIIVADVKNTVEFFKVHHITVTIQLNQRLCLYPGVYVLEFMFGDNFSDIPPFKMQVTDEYPAEIPMFLELGTLSSSVPLKFRKKVEQVVLLFRKSLRYIKESHFRITDLIWEWHKYLRVVFCVTSDKSIMSQLKDLKKQCSGNEGGKSAPPPPRKPTLGNKAKDGKKKQKKDDEKCETGVPAISVGPPIQSSSEPVTPKCQISLLEEFRKVCEQLNQTQSEYVQ